MDKLKALFEAAGLPADFGPKASILFEASVNEAVESRLKVEVKKIQEAAEENLEKAKDDWIKESEEDVDDFLDKTIKEWAAKNEAALTGHVKSSIAESIMKKFKAVLESEGMEMPEEDKQAMKEAEEEIAKLQEEVEAKEEELKEAKRKIVEFTKAEIIGEAVRGLSRVTADRIRSLSESTTFRSPKQFARNVSGLVEALSGKKLKMKESLADENRDGDKDGGANDPDASGGNRNAPAVPNKGDKLKEGTGGSEKFPADAKTDVDATGANVNKAAIAARLAEARRLVKEADEPIDVKNDGTDKGDDKPIVAEGKSKYFKEDTDADALKDEMSEAKRLKEGEDDKGVDGEDKTNKMDESVDIVALTMKALLRG